MKKFLCVLLALAFLFSLVACTAAESETSDEPNTTAPVETAGPEESGAVTEPGTTAGKVVTRLPRVDKKPEFSDGQFVWNEEQLPTIKNIKIGPNTFTNPTPTEEELANFFCQVLFYLYSFYGGYWTTPYLIPYDETVTRVESHTASEFHPLDRSYIKNMQYMRSVIESYFFQDGPYKYKADDFFTYYFSGTEDDAEDVWGTFDSEMSYSVNWDPSLINFVIERRWDGYTDIRVFIYYEIRYQNDDGEVELYASTDIKRFTLAYNVDEGVWKIGRVRGTVESVNRYDTLPRDDFGKRLTIEKAD